MSRSSRLLRALVVGYQRLRVGRPSPCRFEPSCSAYAVEALERLGSRRGAWLAVRRLLRCHPWGGQGWDPVPLPGEHNSIDPMGDAISAAPLPRRGAHDPRKVA